MSRNAYEKFKKFWKTAIDASENQLDDGGVHFTSSGTYLERNQDLIYVLTNHLTGSIIFNSNPKYFDYIKSQISSLEKKKLTKLSKNFFLGYNLPYDDIDFLLDGDLIRPEPLDDGFILQRYNEDMRRQLEIFLNSCTAEEKDILDLSPSDKSIKIWLMYHGDQIVSVASYCSVANSDKITDITIVTNKKFRGKGIAKHILFALMSDAIDNGYTIRYRVREDRLSSISLVEKLGLKKFNHIQAFEKTNDKISILNRLINS